VKRRALVHDTVYGHLAGALSIGQPVKLDLGKFNQRL